MAMLPIIQCAIKRCGKVLLIALISCSSALASFGLENHWTGAGGDMYWTNSANWSLGVPDSTQNVVIGNTATNPVVLDTAGMAGSFSLGATQGMAVLNIDGGSLECLNSGQVGSNATLYLNGALTAETIAIAGYMNWHGGELNIFGETLVGASGSFELGSGISGAIHTSVINNGTIRCYATNLSCDFGVEWSNNQSLVLYSNLTFGPATGVLQIPQLHNAGTLLVPDESGTVRLCLGGRMINTGSLLAGSNAVLELVTTNAGLLELQDGTVFGGQGVVRFAEGNGEVTCDGWMNVDGTVELDGGAIWGLGPFHSGWSGSGLLRWLRGTMGDFYYLPGLHVEMSGPGEKIVKGLCRSEAEVHWRSTGKLLLASAASTDLQIWADFILETNCTTGIEPGGFENPFFSNFGTMRVPKDQGTVSLVLGVRMNGDGTFWTGSNAVLQVGTTNNGMFEAYDETTFDGEGLVRFVGGTGEATFTKVHVNGTVELAGASINPAGNNAEWRGPGLLRWLSGSLGYFSFYTDFHVEVVGAGDKIVSGRCENRGEIRWQSGGALNLSSTVETELVNSGEFIFETNCVMGIEPGGFMASRFNNEGTLRVPADQGLVSLSVAVAFENRGTIWTGSNTTWEVGTTNNGSIELQGITTIDGDGLLRLVEGPGEVLNVDVLVNGTVELAGADVYGGVWFGPGLLRWQSGSMTDCAFEADFHVEISGSGEKTVRGMCVNRGEVRWQSEGRLLLSSAFGTTFENAGYFILETNCITGIAPGGFADPYLYNSGTLRVPASQGATLLTLGTRTFNAGTLLADTNAVLQVATTNNGLFEAQAGTVFDGEGVVRFAEGTGAVTCEGGMIVNGTAELAGANIYGKSEWSGPGLLRWSDGSMGSFTFASGFHVEMSGVSNKYVEGSCTNLGEVRWLQDSVLSIRSGPAASFVNGGLFSQEVGGSWHDGIVISNLAGGTFLQKSGKFSIGPFDNQGTLRMTGGILNPEPSIKFHPSSTCHFVLGGTSATTNHGLVSFGLIESIPPAQITLGGKLLVTLTNGFVPATSATYLIISDGGWGTAFIGQFNQTELPPLQSNLVWHVAYTAGLARLRTVPPPGLTGTTLLPDGSFQFSLTGSAGGNFEIQASTNLVDWQTVTNGAFDGSVIYTDLDTANYTRRFYRGLITK
jgi:hypothetical protein